MNIAREAAFGFTYIGSVAGLALVTTPITALPAVVYGTSSYLAGTSVSLIYSALGLEPTGNDLRSMIKITVCLAGIVFAAIGSGIGALSLMGVSITFGTALKITLVSFIPATLVLSLFQQQFPL